MTTPRPRFESLDSFRGFAALMLAIFHFPAIFFGAENPLVRHASVFTDVFFGLSGFLLMSAYGHKLQTARECGTFVKNRLLRLYPLYLATTLLVLAMPAIAYASDLVLTWVFTGTYAGDFVYPREPWANILGDVFLLQGFGLYPMLHLNFPAWSMGALFFSSVLFAIIVYFKQARATLFIGIIAACLCLLAWRSPAYMNATYDFGVVRCIAGFFSGALAWQVWRSLPRTPRLHHWAVVGQAVAFIVLVGFMCAVLPLSSFTLLTPLIVIVFLLAFSIDYGDFADALEHRYAKWLSARSYSILLNQASLLVIGHQTKEWLDYFHADVATSLTIGLIALIAYLAALLYISDLTYRHIELRFTARKAAPNVETAVSAV